jgi:hypothetical protein
MTQFILDRVQNRHQRARKRLQVCAGLENGGTLHDAQRRGRLTLYRNDTPWR